MCGNIQIRGVSVKTLHKWDNDGRLKAFRNPFNRRYYTHNKYVEYMDKIVQDIDKNYYLYKSFNKWTKTILKISLNF